MRKNSEIMDFCLSQRLSQVIEITESGIERLADQALESGNNPGSPREPDRDDIIEVCKKCL